MFSKLLSPNRLNQMRSTLPFCSIRRLLQPSPTTLTSSWRYQVHPIVHILFRPHFSHMILAACTERPSTPTSTPLLDALKFGKSAQRDKGVIQRNHPHHKDAAQASKKIKSKTKAAATSRGG